MKTRTFSLTGLLLLALSPVYFAAPAPAPEVPKLRATLKSQHQGNRPLAIGPDGKILAAAYDDGTVILWSVADGKEITSFSADTHRVGVAFSPDGKFLATAGDQPSVKLWRIAGKCELTDTFQCPCGDLLFGPDGKSIACRGPSGIRLIDLEKKEIRHILKVKGGIPLNGMLYTPEGKLLAAVHNLKSSAYDFYDVLEGKILVTLKPGATRGPAFSADGKTMVTANTTTLRLWEVATGEAKVTVKIDDRDDHPGCFAFNPKGTLLAVSFTRRDNRTGTISLFDTATGKELAVLKDDKINVSNNLLFSPDGKTLASSSSSDDTLKLWSIPEVIKAEK